MFDPRPLCCSSLTTAVGGTTDTNFVDSAHPTVARISFHMDKTHPLSSSTVVHSMDVTKDPFRPCEKGEELLGPKVPYLSSIGALMYLANCTHPYIAFLSIY